MESAEVTPSVRTPPRSREISWLGGAIFGRSRRDTATAQDRNEIGILTLALIAVIMEGTSAGLDIWGPGSCLAVTIMLALLNGLWIKRFYGSVKMVFRIESIAMLFVEALYAYHYIS